MEEEIPTLIPTAAGLASGVEVSAMELVIVMALSGYWMDSVNFLS